MSERIVPYTQIEDQQRGQPVMTIRQYIEGETVTDLAAFLLARYDEIEAIARGARPGRWSVSHASGVAVGGQDVSEAWGIESDHSWGDAAWPERTVVGVVWDRDYDCPDPGIVRAADAAHIAYWDPARVLAEVEAKRQIVELHRDDREHHCPTLDGGSSEQFGYMYGWAEEDENPQRCPTLRLLALPYVDHPDYQEIWRP